MLSHARPERGPGADLRESVACSFRRERGSAARWSFDAIPNARKVGGVSRGLDGRGALVDRRRPAAARPADSRRMVVTAVRPRWREHRVPRRARERRARRSVLIRRRHTAEPQALWMASSAASSAGGSGDAAMVAPRSSQKGASVAARAGRANDHSASTRPAKIVVRRHLVTIGRAVLWIEARTVAGKPRASQDHATTDSKTTLAYTWTNPDTLLDVERPGGKGRIFIPDGQVVQFRFVGVLRHS